MALLTRDDVQTAPHAITREEIRDLLSLEAGRPCVSIYMPTYRSGSETQQNPIRLKNLLRSIQDRPRSPPGSCRVPGSGAGGGRIGPT